jgi:hypothetical protein
VVKRICGDDSGRVAACQNSSLPGYLCKAKAFLQHIVRRLFGFYLMHTLNDREFQIQAEPALRRVFADYASTGQWFSPSITTRKVIYPCFHSFEEAIPLGALVAVATAIADEGCFITLDWRTPGQPYHCYVPLSELEEGYAGEPESEKLIGVQLGMGIYNHYVTVFSASGKWGIQILEDGLALLGGTPEFMNMLQELVPNLDKQIHDFLYELYEAIVRDEVDRPEPNKTPYFSVEWLYEILFQVYGQKVAAVMIQDAGLPQ